ncbi:hypothetical protein FA95DRAFT_1574456 [Auriscalpium vulgare]|uniref:Uncharacterized protein n=1 Tax=Auriscalpium vulgare TaxID=40419 RepID=A0ACB8RKJ8_9AGAM|nr:hypothetical protein FA95DRAFT_1574456 [Auriscalpium vulgare]
MSQAPPPPPPTDPPSGQVAPARVGKSRRFSFYAVVNGEQVGVFSEWLVAARLVTGWPSAQFRGFHSLGEAASAYHTALSVHPNPPPEHPASLVFHFANPHLNGEAHDAAPTDDPSAGASHAGAHVDATSADATPLSLQDTSPLPPSPAAGPPSLPAAGPPSLPAAGPPSLPTAGPSSLPAAGPSSLSTSGGRQKASFRRPSQEELNALADVMRSLELDELLQYLIGRRNPPLIDEPSEDQPVVMTVSLNRDVETGEVADGYRVVTRTYAPPDEPDDDVFSTAPHSPSSAGSVISLTSTPSASPSLSSVTPSAATVDSADQHTTTALNMPLSASSESSTPCPCPIINSTVAVTTAICEERSRTPMGVPPSASNAGEATAGGSAGSTGVVSSAASTSCNSGACLRAQFYRPVDGDEWYAVARGHVTGVFRGPLQNVRPFVIAFPGAFFCGFRTRDEALAWFVEHDYDST